MTCKVKNQMTLEALDISVEVIEIYPNLQFQLPRKLKEQGTCHIILKVGDFIMEIKNIRYQIRVNGGVWVGPPINVYPDPSKKKHGKVSVPTITFKDPAVFDKIKEEIGKDLLEEIE